MDSGVFHWHTVLELELFQYSNANSSSRTVGTFQLQPSNRELSHLLKWSPLPPPNSCLFSSLSCSAPLTRLIQEQTQQSDNNSNFSQIDRFFINNACPRSFHFTHLNLHSIDLLVQAVRPPQFWFCDWESNTPSVPLPSISPSICSFPSVCSRISLSISPSTHSHSWQSDHPSVCLTIRLTIRLSLIFFPFPNSPVQLNY